MGYKIEDIRNTLARISKGDEILEMLMEFERTLDSTEVFAYENWLRGELVKGPNISRYWFTTWWMFPEKYMPNPDAALRLEKIGCKVSFRKDMLKHPSRVLSPQDITDKKTKRAEIKETPVWIVKIKMPLRYITDRMDAIEDHIDYELNKQDIELAKQFSEPLVPEEEPALENEIQGETMQPNEEEL